MKKAGEMSQLKAPTSIFNFVFNFKMENKSITAKSHSFSFHTWHPNICQQTSEVSRGSSQGELKLTLGQGALPPLKFPLLLQCHLPEDWSTLSTERASSRATTP